MGVKRAQTNSAVKPNRPDVSLFGRFIKNQEPESAYAPNLSNIFALACIRRIKYFDSKIPREPRLAPVSVKRSSLSHPLSAECKRTGCGCQECPLSATGVEWSPVTTRTSGFFFIKIGRAASKSSMAFFLALKLPSSPDLSVYL